MDNNSNSQIKSILVIEDDTGLNRLICKNLRNAGFKVNSMVNGSEAIEYIKHNKEILILLDYSLPDMTGKELIEKLYSEKIQIPPFMFMTGQGHEQLAVELLQFGARDYIIKDGNFIDLFVGNVKKTIKQINNENELKASQEQVSYLASLVDKVSDAIISVRYEEGNFLIKSWNKAAENVYGWKKHEVLGINISKVLPTFYSKTNQEKVKQKLLQDGIWKGDIIQKHKSGKEIYINSSATIIKNSDGIVTGAVILNHDITDLIKANNILKESEKNLKKSIATKDRFFSIIAHDLKSPFNSILGFSELLASNDNNFDDEDIKNISTNIYNESKVFYALLENLLDWSRSQRKSIVLNKKVLSAKKIIEDSISLLKSSLQRKEIELNLHTNGSDSFFVDEHTIKTIIRNLIDNAIKYTNRKGKINIKTRKNDNSIIISIADTGIGISKDKINELFSFENNNNTRGTENERGTGLGLVVCREFVELHGGTIKVKSEKNVGSEFTIEIPIF